MKTKHVRKGFKDNIDIGVTVTMTILTEPETQPISDRMLLCLTDKKGSYLSDQSVI